jgi:hypothetical protein
MFRDKYFTLRFDKYYKETVDSFVDSIDSILHDWRDELKLALSDDLPDYMRSKLRTPRDRLFPYMNTGELRDSVDYSIDTHKTDKSTVITIETKIGSNHGLKGREDAGWLGWMEDVMHRPQGRGRVHSISDVFNKANKLRRKV